MKLKTYKIIICSLITIFFIYLSLNFMQVHASTFSYNMTDDLQKETNLLNACITFNLQIPECDAVYGSIPK